MGTVTETVGRRRRWSTRRVVLVALTLVVLLVATVVVLNWIGGSDGFGTITLGSGPWSYVAIAALVFGDALCAVFPGETTVNAGATLAAQGSLNIWLVMLAAAIGAVVGDSTLYWVARGAGSKFQPRVDAALANDKVAVAMSYLGTSAPALLIFGRYVPGMRFVVNASYGVTRFPYRKFAVWSALGGTLWAIYTATLAYLVATALANFPLASVVISGTITTVAIVLVFLRLRRTRRQSAAASGAPDAATTAAGSTVTSAE